MANKFEDEIRESAKFYRRHGIAVIEHLPVQGIRTPTGFMFTKKAPFDFFGVLKGGQFFGAEAKMTIGTRLQLGKSGLKQHQLAALLDYATLGAYTCVMWKRGDKALCIPSSDVSYYLKEHSRKSLLWNDFVGFGENYIRMETVSGASIVWDFLARVDKKYSLQGTS